MGTRALIVMLAGTAAGLWAWGDLDSVNFWDGAAPLTSPSGISRLFWTALVLLLGFWLGSWAEERRLGSGLG